MAAEIRNALVEEGFSVDVVHRGIEGEHLASTTAFDIIILDQMLPDRDGVEICRNLRYAGVASKILFVSALDSAEAAAHGLNSGADDYLRKPFVSDHFMAHVRALLRRGDVRRLRCDDLELDLYDRTVRRGQQHIRLTARECAVLEVFMRHPNRDLARKDIGQAVWGAEFSPATNALEIYISSIRKKIGGDSNHGPINVIKGFGYKLVCDKAIAEYPATHEPHKSRRSEWPTDRVVKALKWSALKDADAFERLVFNLVSEAPGYTNPLWVMQTNAPDGGRDLSIDRTATDSLMNSRIYRVIVQCKHRPGQGIGMDELAKLMPQMQLWEPPKVDELIIATSGRFTKDAVNWIERRNLEHHGPTIIMWAESHLEGLLASRPHLVQEFGLL